MRSSVISKPVRGSGASSRSRRPRIAIWNASCRSSAAMLRGERVQRLGRVHLVFGEPGHGLAQRDLLQQGRDLVEELAVVGRELVDGRDGLEEPACIALGQPLHEAHDLLAVHGAEHRSRVGLGHAAAAEGQHLVEQRQRVAQAAVRRAREQLHRRRLEGDALGVEDVLQPRRDQGRGQALQVELQAARQHGDRQLLRIGGREQELDVRRRLLERLQERIERMRRQHVHFVDQVDLVAPAGRQVLDVLEQLARVVHLRCARPRRPRSGPRSGPRRSRGRRCIRRRASN